MKMSNCFLLPDRIEEKLSHVPLSIISDWGIKGIILDVDNTLLAKSAKRPDDEVLEWVERWKKHVNIVLLSNNIPSKIQRASIPLDLPYIAWTIKPLPWYFSKALKKLGLGSSEVCVIGDQLFTDILGGKWAGTKTVYIRPINLKHEMIWTKGMRFLERKVMKQWTISP